MMYTIFLIKSALDWLLADPAHVVLVASVIAAVTPSPDPNSVAGKLYRVIDILALNILRAKGSPSAAVVMTPAGSASAASVPSGVKSADTTKQAGFTRGVLPHVLLVVLSAVGLCACTAAQSAFTQTNAQVVQAAMGAGKDDIVAGRELLCGAPYQVVVNAMADDAGISTAMPALCPAMKSVAVALPIPKSLPVSETVK